MITTRITFLLKDEGLPGWQVSALKQLCGYFRSIFVFYNLSRGKHTRLSQSLNVLSLKNSAGHLCQIAIEGLDAELACMVFTEYLSEQTILLSTSHRKNHAAEQLFASHPAFSLPFAYRWDYECHAGFADKLSALHYLAARIAPGQTRKLLEQFCLREKISTTALPNRVALPHVMSDAVATPVLMVMPLAQPLDWQSACAPVSLVIGLVLPQPLNREVVTAMTRLTRWLIDDLNVQLLLDAKREETLKGILLHVMAHSEPETSSEQSLTTD
ncbi:PTS sugar transporter subunit IIA [Vibrio mangrovi]|uniref:Heat-responsive suppressor HrsA n=1 Tax=Vibrio mangrovi TaxID=474394 RepID=A0A1Y6IQR4_9VIBR|nr:PTS sugar transporter subunit IIA [Vibrio mangrovi]MDW6003236.1 PTS sugar transporter subunit IIA [Vibrio mangrovi]SMR99976.1 Heat-responsive suppressor HrsA [Vibrio mangrovi]